MRTVRLAVPALAAVAAAGCSYTSYTPPARMMPLETAIAPAAAHTDVQGEGSIAGAVLGFGTTNGAVRVRQGVTDEVAVQVEGGVMNVDGKTEPGTDHNAYLGRVGVHAHAADREPGPHFAMTAGVGGGYSPLAGRWISEDMGVILSGNGAWVVPIVALEGFASQPIHAQPFEYQPAGGGTVQHDALTVTAGFRMIAGLEIRDGHGAASRESLTLGAMMGGIYKPTHSDAFMGLGAALRLSW